MKPAGLAYRQRASTLYKGETMTTDKLVIDGTGQAQAAAVLERVILAGDLKDLTPAERVVHYRAVCDSVGLNPLTKPFDYLSLQGKTILYANKSCEEQLRKNHNVSVDIGSTQVIEGIYLVVVRAKIHVPMHGLVREDVATGAVSLQGLSGEAKANALMKAETKAKRRVTLSICGLGLPDESEVLELPDAERLDAEGNPDPIAQERTRLYGLIVAAADRMNLKPEERKAAWKEHLREAKPENAEPAALQDLLTALEERERGERV
jgi:hypothetical protein